MTGPLEDGLTLERKRAEDALRDSEAQYRRLFETAQDGILILDAHSGSIIDVNPFLIRLLDYPREEFIGRALWDLGAFKQVQESKAAFRELQDKKFIRYENFPLETRSGRRVNVEFVSNVYGVNGKSVIQCNIRDITARKKIEEALKDSERSMAGLIASAMDSIITVDEQQRIVLFNAAAEKMFRCSQADALGQPLERFIPDCFRAAHSGHDRQLGKSGSANRDMGDLISLWALRADGEKFEIEATISQVESHGKRLFTGVLRDVTARKQAEATLREYVRIVEGLEEMILVVDRQYRYVIVNRAYLNFRGVTAEQVLGLTTEEVVGREAFEGIVKEQMDKCFSGEVVHYEMTYNFATVGEKNMSISYFPIHGPAGVDRIACVLQDITERKRAEVALLRSEERFSKAFCNNPLAITISTRAEGRYLDANEALLQLLGYERREVIGHTSAELHFWAEPQDREEILQKLDQEKNVVRRHTRYRTAKGEIREAETWMESIELGGQACLLGITRDVTEVQQLEAQFRQAQKMEAVGRLAGGVAHDFNNILGIILGYSDISLGLVARDSAISRHLSEIKKATKRGAELTQQLLAFSRKQVVFPKILDLNDVVNKTTTMFLRLVGEDIEIEFRPTVPLGSVKADPGQIEQVLMNLVVNARDAMPTGGKIIIATTEAELDEEYVSRHSGCKAGQYSVLVVSDTGCGMDEYTKSKIFDPFFTTKPTGQGTGLGLSTVYGIVKQNDGYIVVYSEVGKGTTLKMYFPRVEAPAEELRLPSEEAEAPRGSETIMVVEDDEALREVTVRLLQDGGYRVIQAKDAEQALAMMASSRPEVDLLLTDVIMPGASGAELAQQVKEGHPKLRSLFMSGYTNDLVSRHGMSIHEASLLEKPFTKKALLKKVYAALHGEAGRA